MLSSSVIDTLLLRLVGIEASLVLVRSTIST